MASQRSTDAPLIVIVGPTASGKTALAIKLARQFHGEIICADSRTIYKDMDIGTAKPTKQEQAAIPHWGLDLIAPGERFTAADFKDYAERKIEEIRQRGHIPLLVGGTGLYVDAILFDYQFNNNYDSKRRAFLEDMTIEQLHEYCLYNNIELPENRLNKRYIVRAIEQGGINKKRRTTIIPDTIVVGITAESNVLKERIQKRAEQIFASNVVEEAILLSKKYGWNNEAMTGNVYPLVRRYLNGELTVKGMKERFILSDWHLARRQRTWLRRNPFIHWFTIEKAEQYIKGALASK